MQFSEPEDQVVKEEILTFINLPYEFNGFIEDVNLVDNELSLALIRKDEADPVKKWVPAYTFAILLEHKQIGLINLRIGYTDGLYYGGNIGYEIDKDYRGHGYAGRACQLISRIAKAHKMKVLGISNEYSNHASKRVCEKLGAQFLRVVRLPKDNPMRTDGHEFENIFMWKID